MKALDLALLEQEIFESDDLSDSARETLLCWVRRYARLSTGRRHLEVIRFIETALDDGLTLYGYAIPTAAYLHEYDHSTVEGIWHQYLKFHPKTSGIAHLKTAS